MSHFDCRWEDTIFKCVPCTNLTELIIMFTQAFSVAIDT